MKTCAISLIIMCLLATVGCSGSTKSNPVNSQGAPIDPSGNWQMRFVDSSNNFFLLSGLFNQTGAVVTGVSFSEVGNGINAVPPTPFQCITQRDVSMANGLVANVSNFTGDISGNFGTIHFSTTLNDPGTEAVGNYTLTPGSAGNCLGIALTGTLVANEVPSVSGSWTGTITCVQNCPTGTTNGTVSFTLAQDDATGAVTGSYTITGIPGISNGVLVSDINDFLSGPNIQEKLQDNNGGIFFITGGPVTSRPLAGFGLDRTFQGEISDGTSVDPLFNVMMGH